MNPTGGDQNQDVYNFAQCVSHAGFGRGRHHIEGPIAARSNLSGIAKADMYRMPPNCQLYQFQTRQLVDNVNGLSLVKHSGKVFLKIEANDSINESRISSVGYETQRLTIKFTTSTGKFIVLMPQLTDLHDTLTYLSKFIAIEPLSSLGVDGHNSIRTGNQLEFGEGNGNMGMSSSLFTQPNAVNKPDNTSMGSIDGNRSLEHPSFYSMFAANNSNNSNNNNNNNNNSRNRVPTDLFGINNKSKMEWKFGQGQSHGTAAKEVSKYNIFNDENSKLNESQCEFGTDSFGSKSMNGNVLHYDGNNRDRGHSPDKTGFEDQKQQGGHGHGGIKHDARLTECCTGTVDGKIMNEVELVELCYYKNAKEFYIRLLPQVNGDSLMQFSSAIKDDFIRCQYGKCNCITFYNTKEDYLNNLRCKECLRFDSTLCGDLKIFRDFVSNMWLNCVILHDRQYYWKHKLVEKLALEENNSNDNNNNNNNTNNKNKLLLLKKMNELQRDFESQLKIGLLLSSNDLNDSCSLNQIQRDLSQNHKDLNGKALKLIIGFYQDNCDLADIYNFRILEELFGCDYAFGVMVMSSFDVFAFVNGKEVIQMSANTFEENLTLCFGNNETVIKKARDYSTWWNNKNESESGLNEIMNDGSSASGVVNVISKVM